MDIVSPLLLGLIRGRYFLITGQTLDAPQFLALGRVSEVLPREQFLPHAWALAEEQAQRPPLVLRYSRALLTRHVSRLLRDLLACGLALAGLGAADARAEED